MPDVVVTAPPFVLKHPIIKIGATGSSVDIACPATNITFDSDQDENTVETFCGTYVTYKPPKWTLTATVAMSYGTNGVWTLLQPMQNTIQPFVLLPDNAAASVSNPVASGTAYVRAFAFVDGAPGEVSEIDIILAVQGAPTWGIVMPAMAEAPAAEPAAEPAPAA